MTAPALRRPAPPESLADALQRIRHHGGRVTAVRREIAEMIYAQREPQTADEIAARLGRQDRSVIYRALAQFEELGIVEHVHLGHGQAVYRRCDLETMPVVCVRCEATMELDKRDAAAFVALVAERTGVDLDLAHFPLTGTCSACRDALGDPTQKIPAG